MTTAGSDCYEVTLQAPEDDKGQEQEMTSLLSLAAAKEIDLMQRQRVFYPNSHNHVRRRIKDFCYTPPLALAV